VLVRFGAALTTNNVTITDSRALSTETTRGGAIAAANYNGTYEVLKVDEGSSVLSCAFSPDKRTIACGTAAGGLTLRGIRSCATQDIVGMTCPPNSMCVDATVLPGSMRLVAVGVWWSDG